MSTRIYKNDSFDKNTIRNNIEKDSYHANKCKFKNIFKVSTYIVCVLFESSRLDEICKNSVHIHRDFVAVQEHRYTTTYAIKYILTLSHFFIFVCMHRQTKKTKIEQVESVRRTRKRGEQAR
jgi:hypothetical protein